MTLALVRSGLKTRLETITSLKGHCYNVVPNQVNGPAFAVVRPVRTQAHATFASRGAMYFEVEVGVSLAGGLEAAQGRLDPYLDASGTESVIAAIEADSDLGGSAGAEDVSIIGWRDYNTFARNGIDYLGATLDVEVYTT